MILATYQIDMHLLEFCRLLFVERSEKQLLHKQGKCVILLPFFAYRHRDSRPNSWFSPLSMYVNLLA